MFRVLGNYRTESCGDEWTKRVDEEMREHVKAARTLLLFRKF
jgi:hypothetical protein